MTPDSKIYIGGHRGLVGSAIVRRLSASGYRNIVTRTHTELDLTNQAVVSQFFQRERPDYVFLAAAKVGGIHANNAYPADFIYQNLAIQTNVIHEAWRGGVKRLLFLGSSCIYPRDCPQPIKEEYLLTGALEPTNRPYAVAKIAGIEQCWSYNRQYGTRFLAVMPTNLYGPGDNYHLENSHVIPALIRKCHEAKAAGAALGDRKQSSVVIWGTGAVRREFLYSDDLGDACVFLMSLQEEKFRHLVTGVDVPPLVNVGAGEDMTIRQLAEAIAEVVGFEGRLVYDSDKPDGTRRKLLDVSRIRALGWQAKTDFRSGLKLAYSDYLDRSVSAPLTAHR